MFCPLCGFEYTQKMNYCKRCGEGLNAPTTVVRKLPPWFGGLYWALSFMCVAGLVVAFTAYYQLAVKGVRGSAWVIMFGLAILGLIAGLMSRQLSRLLSFFQAMPEEAPSEKPSIVREPPPSIAAPTDPIAGVIEPASVVEHTTRQFAGKRVSIDG